MDTNLGKILKDRYEIKQKISVGGMSNVYLAYDLILNKNVVLKILYKHLFNDKKTEAIFLNEIKITSQLKHKNIIRLYDYFVFDGYWCLVLEYTQGINLREFLVKQKTFSEKQTVNIALQILDALTLAQSYKIIHRDIKPENILLIKEKNVKILDFGVSVDKYFSEDIFKTKIIGSLKYVSPEIITNKEVDNQSDLYSLGIMMFEMLIGQPPFIDKDYLGLIKKHLYESVPRVRNYESKISQYMENIIVKSTAKNIVERYQNANEMISDLQKCFYEDDKHVKPLFLFNDSYQGKIQNPIFFQNLNKKQNFFWLNKWFVFVIIILELSIFIIILFKIVIQSWQS